MPEAVPGLLEITFSGLGVMPIAGCAGVVNVTVTSAVFTWPIASVTVARNDSLRFSPQFRLALKVAEVVPLTLTRLPDNRLQAVVNGATPPVIPTLALALRLPGLFRLALTGLGAMLVFRTCG